MRPSRALLISLAASVVATGMWAVTVSGQFTRPSWYIHRTPDQGLAPSESKDPKTDLGLDYQEVEFEASDGSVLRGWWVPTRRGSRLAVLAVHGGGGDRRHLLPHVPIFLGLDYNTLLIDCREHGISDGARRGFSLGVREHEDVSAGVAFLKTELGMEYVAVIGSSQGAVSAILAAAKDPLIDLVIAINPFSTVDSLIYDNRTGDDPSPALTSVPPFAAKALGWFLWWRSGGWSVPQPLDVVDAIAPRPLFLMHGTADTVIPHSHSEELFAKALEPKELWTAADAPHTGLFATHPEEFTMRVSAFLLEHLGRK
jgi:alpha-beta hydrolase superfamily lysophospholipase